ncbi:coiled-coil domain-containing protein 106b isoform X2 [Cynoglossus semilaevis]|uniref:coiled-coil domain-containing protein 106b isoform X2 n=1 Tax=Cynoglossus semilaevis TaxID=244447 RepID=UPI0007DC91B1|nr:coiled-coil domain-containing protein 106-like isoform X2 [Cynoglossus semilaevis]
MTTMNPANREEGENPAEGSGPAGEGPAAGGLYLDAYEVSFPLEHSVDRMSCYHHLGQGQHLMDEPVGAEPPPPPYSPFILVSNLRAHLYVALEKNSWLQKRIQELEEERNFLRCQLDRFIISIRSPEPDCYTNAKRSFKAPPPCPVPPSSPMTTRSGMTLKRLQGTGRQSRYRGHAHTQTISVPVKQEFHLEEEKFYTENEFMEDEEDMEEEEEEEEDLTAERGVKKRGGGERRMKMRRVFTITHSRERQRVKDPEGVLIRYKKILSTYQRVRSMSRAFQIHGVDRNTMASTSPIAELLLVAPDKVAEVGEFEASKEKLLDYARRCYRMMDEVTHAKVQSLKKIHKLLPISYRFRN